MSGADAGPAVEQINTGNGPDDSGSTSPVMEGLKQDAGAAVALAERATLLASLSESSSNGNGNGHVETSKSSSAKDASRGDQFARFQMDAPSCDNCGSITVRNGNCYLCHNCGASMGCS